MILKKFWKFALRFSLIFTILFPIICYFIIKFHVIIGKKVIIVIVEPPFYLFSFFSRFYGIYKADDIIVLLGGLFFCFLIGLKWAIFFFILKQVLILIFKKEKTENHDLLDSDDL